ncbi:hypothetical protein FA95DRAFT_559 [Auriscalpium vulgare]|uniref:Uncharacterized protein n=1 Tax=Auriscalpium vulgare TaxID=40419 RepID=A0ACB8SBK7_9AGAM|nr:hypothetical protein FA95DRAFT_559 [Auriscalpium vulgare]
MMLILTCLLLLAGYSLATSTVQAIAVVPQADILPRLLIRQDEGPSTPPILPSDSFTESTSPSSTFPTSTASPSDFFTFSEPIYTAAAPSLSSDSAPTITYTASATITPSFVTAVDSTPTTSPVAPVKGASSASSVSVGIIAGAAIGGLVFVCACIVGIIYLRQRLRHSGHKKAPSAQYLSDIQAHEQFRPMLPARVWEGSPDGLSFTANPFAGRPVSQVSAWSEPPLPSGHGSHVRLHSGDSGWT